MAELFKRHEIYGRSLANWFSVQTSMRRKQKILEVYTEANFRFDNTKEMSFQFKLSEEKC